MKEVAMDHSSWPELPYPAWRDTAATLQLWTQIVGKVRLALTPWVNHGWQVPLYVTASGLTTSAMPYQSRSFQIDFDFCHHALVIRTSDPQHREFPLVPMPVAEFYDRTMQMLRDLGIEVNIWTMPVEVADAIPFEKDQQHKSYDADAAQRFWRVLLQTDRLMKKFRGRFLGKASPVHFFWGSFDLAVTRFSGRTAPPHPGGMPNLGDWVAVEAYSHEVSSCGFWPGNGGFGNLGIFRTITWDKLENGQRKVNAGETWVSMVEFSTPIKAMGVMSYGESSQPGSKHNSDQLHFVAERKLRTLWVKRPDVEKHVEERTKY